MAAARPLLVLLCLVVVGAGAAGCVDTSGPVTPAAPDSSTLASAEQTPEPTTEPATPSAPAGNYPASARSYTEAVLTAWRTGQFVRVADLTTPTVQAQLQGSGSLEPNWSFVNCQGAAGSSYCQFVNADGDVATLRLDNQKLGQAHAVTEVKLDPTSYSNSAVEYVKAFIEGWRTANTRRMAVLANQSEVDYFTHFVPPGTYSTCATLAAGIASVRVYNPDGLNYTLSVRVATLGSRHAIIGHANTPAACF